jgi:hypothetical protein
MGLESAAKLVSAFQEFSMHNSDEALYRGAILCFFAKAYKSFQAIHVLWKQGFAEDATTLLRSLFELMLQATWLDKSPAPRARRFMEHERVAQYLHYERLKKTGRNLELLKSLEKRTEQLATLKGDFDRFKSNFATGKKAKHFHEHWWNGSIPSLAEWLGTDYQKQYEYLYWLMSGYVHSDAHSFHTYLMEDPRGFVVNCNPAEPTGLAQIIPLLSSGWMLDIVYIANKAFNVGFDRYLTDLKYEWNHLAISDKASVAGEPTDHQGSA